MIGNDIKLDTVLTNHGRAEPGIYAAADTDKGTCSA
jgi:hypothetical protein